MKRLVFLLLGWTSFFTSPGQQAPVRFALLSDTHIGSPDGKAEEDLRRSVRDINQLDSIAFVILTGDITELGRNEELALARRILDSLRVPYHIIPGNHDAGWSESGGQQFLSTFGSDVFSFEFAGIRFLGCPSGPYLRMSDGHVPRSALNWLDRQLDSLRPHQPVVFFNHYPIDNSLDNWYEITDRLHRVNTWAILCGHGHANRNYRFEGIPGVMCRSNLRAKAAVGGYNLVELRTDSMIFRERHPGVITLPAWTSVAIHPGPRAWPDSFTRPNYRVNLQFPAVRESWKVHAPANVISTPAVFKDEVLFGNQDGLFVSLSLRTGRNHWSFQTGGAIFSSPAVGQGNVVFGSADGNIYCLQARSGKLLWKYAAAAAVLGSPLICGDTVFIGSSDHGFYSLSLKTGKMFWRFSGLDGPVVSTPVMAAGMVLFGAWDRHCYALDRNTGQLRWAWNNGSPIRNFSPAACIPVVHEGVVFVVAPDRYLTAIELASGRTLWRTQEATVRESIGISEDGQWIYGKTMQDTLVAFRASAVKQGAAWKLDCGFGYEHAPSMLIEKQGVLVFGTRNGVVYGVDPKSQRVNWAHKLDNSMVNTVRVLSRKRIVVATMDGTVSLLEVTE